MIISLTNVTRVATCETASALMSSSCVSCTTSVQPNRQSYCAITTVVSTGTMLSGVPVTPSCVRCWLAMAVARSAPFPSWKKRFIVLRSVLVEPQCR